ncbi:MAG: putative toxin-antitoxin system toxin component, PIN family [Muribaculaceae bacterium]|nr:putative toxin-antitoxin system toxin component, PIN family [Muribaculaceae bacterium]
MEENDKVRAVIDTNVLVSALLSSSATSNPALVIRAVLNGAITPLFNNQIIKEYRDVLSRKKFKFKKELIEDFLRVFTTYGLNSTRADASDESFPDSDDIVFYEVAISIDHAYLVTGNIKHFPQKAFVVTPAQMVDILRNKGLLEY